LAAAFLLGGYYLYIYWALGNDSAGQSNYSHLTYSQTEIGFEFDYPEGPEGYAIDEKTPSDLGIGLLKNIILSRTEDSLRETPVGGEGPPVIVISVFQNFMKLFPRAWADENTQYSNINLIMGEVDDVAVDGANAIRYMSDGLYVSENVVVAHGDNMYVITCQSLNTDSLMCRDYQALIESIRFIPTPEQN